MCTVAPVAGAPLIGFGDLPQNTMSLIDIHGVNDDTIPYDLDHAEGQGKYLMPPCLSISCQKALRWFFF